MPCSDGLNEADIEHENTAEHNHHEDEDDACPITCFCACCGISITYQLEGNITFNEHQKISTLVLFHYQSNYRYNVNAKIWQPPQWFS